jgi:hypothetical protein
VDVHEMLSRSDTIAGGYSDPYAMKLNEYSTQGWDFVKKATFVITLICRVITKLSTGLSIGLQPEWVKENHRVMTSEITVISGENQDLA